MITINTMHACKTCEMTNVQFAEVSFDAFNSHSYCNVMPTLWATLAICLAWEIVSLLVCYTALYDCEQMCFLFGQIYQTFIFYSTTRARAEMKKWICDYACVPLFLLTACRLSWWVAVNVGERIGSSLLKENIYLKLGLLQWFSKIGRAR